MKWVRDRTGRFAQRPHYQPIEIDVACESLITAFLRERHGEAHYPIDTNDLIVLIERETADFDMYADLSAEGEDIEGVTYFAPGGRPDVCVAARLANDPRSINRFRTTVTHELGHVKFHNLLYPLEAPLLLFAPDSSPPSGREGPKCNRQVIEHAPSTDWMEWQAGYACGAFLMPITAVQTIVREVRSRATAGGAAAAGDPIAGDLVHAVQAAFEVSGDAARVRLERLGHLVPVSAGVATADLFT